MVHIRRCSAGICQQWLIAEWLGLSVTVRVRVILGLGLGNGVLPFFFFFSFLVNVKDIICCALLACIVDVRRQYGTVCMLTGACYRKFSHLEIYRGVHVSYKIYRRA